MLAKHGRLLEPEEMKSSRDPNDFTPEAQFRYRRELEPPREEEGFSAIERLPFAGTFEGGSGKAIFFDAAGETDALKRYAEDGYRLIRVTYLPGASDARFRERVGGLDVEVLACVHPPGPTVCWCRKPLPGLGVVAIEEYDLDPKQCIVVAASAADRGFAERLGFELA